MSLSTPSKRYIHTVVFSSFRDAGICEDDCCFLFAGELPLH